MKGTLEFTLPDEQAEFDAACQAGEMLANVHGFLNALRMATKHAEMSEETASKVDEIKALAYEYLGEYQD